MVWRFLKHYGMNKATGIVDDFSAAVVAFDPKGASTAQIALMEMELSKLGGRLAETEAELRREHQETLNLKRDYEQHLKAAELLEATVAAEKDPAKAAEVEASLVKILDALERMKPDIEREEREDAEGEGWRAELRRAYEDLAGKIRGAHVELKTARPEMEMAQLGTARAVDRDRRADAVAGLTSTMNSLSVALDAMSQQTAQVRAETEALKLKASVLQPQRLDGDPRIAAVLDKVRGAPAADRRSAAQRLAALGGRSKPATLETAA